MVSYSLGKGSYPMFQRGEDAPLPAHRRRKRIKDKNVYFPPIACHVSIFYDVIIRYGHKMAFSVPVTFCASAQHEDDLAGRSGSTRFWSL